jgi:hypothetical protein
MSNDHDLTELLAKAKAKWDALTPAQQATYLRRKSADLNRQIKELDKEAKKPKQ